jgi:hypothetical protein
MYPSAAVMATAEDLLRYGTSFGSGCCTYESYEMALDPAEGSA